MWSHCMVCSQDLGWNEDVEAFPVGKTQVFDPEHGRLWVVCMACRRWNLTPLEERWEALETLERLWESAVMKAKGNSLALGRLRSGMKVVRIGRDASALELAAWRWGQRSPFAGPSLSKALFANVLTVGAVAVTAAAPVPVLVGAGAAAYLGAVAWLGGRIRPAAAMDDAGSVTSVTRRELLRAGMSPRDDWLGWSIHIERKLIPTRTRSWFNIHGLPTITEPSGPSVRRWVEFTGGRAVALARRAFPLLNRRSLADWTVADALELVRDGGGPARYLTTAAAAKPRWVQFRHYPSAMRLSLEMALFQDEERRALDGEVKELEFAWREAEAIAAIADNLIPPPGWEEFRRRYRARGDAASDAGSESAVP